MGTNKVLLGGLALLALFGATFAWGGFFGHFAKSLPDDVREQLMQAMEDKDIETIQAIREQYAPADGPLSQLTDEQKEELASLRIQIHEAMESGDSETAQALHEQMRELLPEPPEGFGPRGPGQGRMGRSGPMGWQDGDLSSGGCQCLGAE